MQKARPAVLMILLILIAGGFYIVDLGNRALDDYDESGYAIVAREMLGSEDPLTPTYLGKPWFEKPPLQFWLMAASAKIFGVNEFSMRLPSAIFGILSIILIFLILLELTGDKEAAFLGGLILITIPIFLAAARHARMDVPVTATILASVYFYLKSRKNPIFLIGIGLSLGIGVLLKSVIGLFGAVIILAWSTILKNWNWLKNRYFWIGLLLMILVVFPWHIYEIAQFGDVFVNEYFGYHLLQRATQNILHNQIAISYYLWVFWKYNQPWGTLFIGLIAGLGWLLFSARGGSSAGGKNNWRKKLPSLYSAAILVLTAAGIVFTVFALSKTRLMPYFTILYPFLAGFFAVAYLICKKIINENWHWLIRIFAGGLLVWAAIVTFNEAFIAPKFYALHISQDEKAIGEYLAENNPKNQPVTVFNWRHTQSLRYYSQRELDILQSGEELLTVKSNFWIVLPTPLLEENQFLKKMPMPYSGEFLTLVEYTL